MSKVCAAFFADRKLALIVAAPPPIPHSSLQQANDVDGV
jgi:hypothetical protein